MKKVLFAAIAVCGFVFANAQSSDNSSAAINVNIVKTVQIVPDANVNSFSVTLDKPGQFGVAQLLPQQDWVIKATDPGTYTISFDRGTIPAGVSLTYFHHFDNILQGPITTIATPASHSFAAGDQNKVKVALSAIVPWGINAGNYSGTMTLTATAQ